MKEVLGLTGLTAAELKGLRGRIAEGITGLPLTSAGLQAAGLGGKPWIAEALAGLNRDGVLVALDLLLAERARPVPRLDLVWTGPEAQASTARDTRVVMRELFERAERNVLIAGFAFDSGGELFEPLYQRMQTAQVRVQVFLNLPRAKVGADVPAHLQACAEQFLEANWPWSDQRPELYCDPRTVAPDSLESLHAKCVVVDDHLTLVGSANFTSRGQTRNIEIGVLIDDPTFGRQVSSQWHGLVSRGLVHKMGFR